MLTIVPYSRLPLRYSFREGLKVGYRTSPSARQAGFHEVVQVQKRSQESPPVIRLKWRTSAHQVLHRSNNIDMKGLISLHLLTPLPLSDERLSCVHDDVPVLSAFVIFSVIFVRQRYP